MINMNRFLDKIKDLIKYILIADAASIIITLLVYIFIQNWIVYGFLIGELSIVVLYIFLHAIRLFLGYIKEGIDIIRFKVKEKTVYKHKEDDKK